MDAVAHKNGRFGLLLDGRYGFDALSEAADLPYWLGRSIEIPKSRPLEFEGSADAAAEIATWPLNQVVKCLIIYHPDDPTDLRDRQERQLRRLFDACRKTGHELLLEIMLPRAMPVEFHTTARAISRIYSLGVLPDWWKLPTGASAAHWRAIQDTIAKEDPLCRGVLLWGLSAPEADLISSFAVVAPFGIVKGFVIGRTIFQDVARAWFAGTLSDTDARDAMARNLSTVVSAWRSVRAGVAK